MSYDVVPYGSYAVLVRFGGAGSGTPTPTVIAYVSAVAEALRRRTGLEEVVPAFGEVLIAWRRERDVSYALRVLAEAVEERNSRARAASPVRTHTLPTTYDGMDLGEVAQRCGHTPSAVAALHSGAAYTVGAVGFQPGFAYLTGLPAELRLPRRARPRSRVPPGSVAVAAAYTAVYPHASPGGWWLIGSVAVPMFGTGDGGGLEGARLSVGDQVRFVDRRLATGTS